jgi:hypothetical protein
MMPMFFPNNETKKSVVTGGGAKDPVSGEINYFPH